MADLKISALTSATTPLGGTEVLPVVQSATTKKTAVSTIKDYILGLANTFTANQTIQTTASTASKLTVVSELDGSSDYQSSFEVRRNGTAGGAIWKSKRNTSIGGVGWVAQVTANNAAEVAATYTDAFAIDNTGNATIVGSTQTDGLVSHAGTGGAFGSNKFNFQWTGSPALWVDGTLLGNINYTSDYRIKRNIASQTESGLAKVMQLRPVVYQMANYNNLFVASDDIKEGFIAHELQEVIPSAVSGQKDAEDQIQSLKLDAVCAVLVKAMQEQQAQIEALKADVAALKGA
jgi:hypothetical protein